MTMLTDAPTDTAAPEAPDAAPVVEQQDPASPAEAAATDGGAQGEQADAPQQEAKPEGAPEAYDWKLSEGVEVDQSGLDAFGAWAKSNNLTQDQANSLLNSMAEASAARQAQAHEAAVNEWITQAQADQEFGGRDLKQNLAVAKRAMDQFGTPELAKLLNDSGLGNHPEIIRAFYRAGKAISEDRFVGGSRVPTVPADPAKRMFPTMN